MEGWRIIGQGRLSKEEGLEASRASRAYLSVKRSGYFGAVATPLALFFVFRQMHRGEPVEMPLIMISIFSAIGMVVPLFLGPMMARQAAPPETLYDIGEAALKLSAGGRTRVIAWDAFKSFDERPDGVWLYEEKVIGVYLPRRFFAVEDWPTLLQFFGMRWQARSAERFVVGTYLRVLFWAALTGVGLLAYQLLK